MPLLAELIRAADEQQMLRYFRAFDFHKDPSKQEILSKLVSQACSGSFETGNPEQACDTSERRQSTVQPEGNAA